PGRIDASGVKEKRAHLCVAVLLDEKYAFVVANEIEHFVSERIGAEPKRIEMHAGLFERADRLVHCNGGRAEINRAEFCRLACVAPDGSRQKLLSGFEF